MPPVDSPVVPGIMISHTASEDYVAQAWQDLITDVFGLARDRIWFSSDPDALDARGPFAVQIENKIRSAAAVISIQSPVSRYRPWLLWEAGIARGINKSIYAVVYERSDTPKKDSILGKLGTPLDAMQQYRGTDVAKVQGILDQLGRDIGCALNTTRLAAALQTYLKAVLSREHCWVWKKTLFDKRIQLVFNPEERARLSEDGIIGDTVEVLDIRGSMALFGLAVDSRPWKTFVEHLHTLKAPWMGSATRWARGLGRALQHALEGLLVGGAEGLPLYFDSRSNQRYRPSVSLQQDHGCETIFTICFTTIPSEIVAVPKTDAGVLIHYLDFTRMMRWGVLEDFEVQSFFRRPYDYSVEERAERISDFLEKIYSVRTEFWNRGLERGSIDHAIEPGDRPVLQKLRDRYLEAIHKIDPEDTGKLPNPLPGIDLIQEVYRDLLSTNKAWYQLAYRNFGREIDKLADDLASS
jgi:hypothetical protein